MLQLFQNRPVCHNPDSQCSLVNFLWFQVICGSIIMVRFQRLNDSDKILETFFTFLSLEHKIMKAANLKGSNMTGS